MTRQKIKEPMVSLFLRNDAIKIKKLLWHKKVNIYLIKILFKSVDLYTCERNILVTIVFTVISLSKIE